MSPDAPAGQRYPPNDHRVVPAANRDRAARSTRLRPPSRSRALEPLPVTDSSRWDRPAASTTPTRGSRDCGGVGWRPPPVGGTRSTDQAVAAVSQPCADFPKSKQGGRRGNRARIAGDARPGKTSPNRLNSRSRRAAPGRPRPRGSLATRTSRPRGRYGGHPGQEAASQLSPYRATEAWWATTGPEPAVRRATTDCQVDGQECGQVGQFGQGRAVACGDRYGGCCWAGSALVGGRSWRGRPVRMA
jgi:hypothetical protein